jgi:hypothetical protein
MLPGFMGELWLGLDCSSLKDDSRRALDSAVVSADARLWSFGFTMVCRLGEDAMMMRMSFFTSPDGGRLCMADRSDMFAYK